MTKDQIIAEQSKLILELLGIGKEKIQTAMNLFCEIQHIPKDEIEKMEVKKEGKLCPVCKRNYRRVSKSGKLSTYCPKCDNEKRKKCIDEKVSSNNS